MTLRALTEASDVFRAGVSVAGDRLGRLPTRVIPERYMGTPANNAEGYRRSSVLPHAEALGASCS